MATSRSGPRWHGFRSVCAVTVGVFGMVCPPVPEIYVADPEISVVTRKHGLVPWSRDAPGFSMPDKSVQHASHTLPHICRSLLRCYDY